LQITQTPLTLNIYDLYFLHSYGSETSPIGDLSEVCHAVVVYYIS
jgi:hypothetical protein